MRALAAVVVAGSCVCAAVAGGCNTPKQYSHTALMAVQTREYDEGFDRVFDEAIGTLFDLGYTVQSSDKRGGFVKAFGVQLKIDVIAPRRTSVRVSTTEYGQARVDKERIDEVLNRIDERLATRGTATPASGSGGAVKGAGR